MTDISQVQVGSTTYDVHDAIARTDVSNEIARAKKAESDEYTRATTAEAALRDSVSQEAVKFAKIPARAFSTSASQAVKMTVSWPVDVSRIVAVVPTYTCSNYSDRVVLSDWDESGVTLRAGVDQYISISLLVLYI